jgi:hypothetical protein
MKRTDDLRACTAKALCGLGLMWGAAACAAGSDTEFANYAFASELGSGVYALDGRTLWVQQLEPGYTLRQAVPRGGRPGIRLILPITVGFFDFQPGDLAHLEVPSSIGALSLEPGVELDYWLTDGWDLYPYVKAGGTFSSSANTNAVIYGVGVRSDYRFDMPRGEGLWRAELAYAGVHYRGGLPNDSFTRLRNGVELRRNLRWAYRRREIQLSPYVLTDIYFNAPEGPASGISARTLQYEVGFMLGVSPSWEIHGIPLPRLGIGYREAGVLSGWRLVIGDPF